MGDRGHDKHGPKRGAAVPLSRELGPRLVQYVSWAEVYFPTKIKRRLHPSSHLATIDMGQNWVGVGVPLIFFWG